MKPSKYQRTKLREFRKGILEQCLAYSQSCIKGDWDENYLYFLYDKLDIALEYCSVNKINTRYKMYFMRTVLWYVEPITEEVKRMNGRPTKNQTDGDTDKQSDLRKKQITSRAIEQSTIP